MPKQLDTAPRSPVAGFSLWFIRHFRLSVILVIISLIFGYLAYSQLLKHPQLELPTSLNRHILVQTAYFVDDSEIIDEFITSPIQNALHKIKDIRSITSTTFNDGSEIAIEFDKTTNIETALHEIRQSIAETVDLPDQSTITYHVLDHDLLNSRYHQIVSLARYSSIEQLQDTASEVAKKLERLTGISAEVILQTTSQIDPISQTQYDYQQGFHRVGMKNGNELEFIPAVAIGIKYTDGADTTALSQQTRNEILEIQKTDLLQGYLVTYAGNDISVAKTQINSLQTAAIYGFGAILLVILLLLNWQAAIITSVFITTVFSATFVVFYLVGYPISPTSIFVFVLVLGLFIDDAIVIIESITYQHRLGYIGIDALTRAINEIGTADIAGTLIALFIFVPMIFTTGPLSLFIQMIPITVTITLIISLFVALSIIPVFSASLIANRQLPKQTDIGKVVDTLQNGIGNQVSRVGTWISDRIVLKYLQNRVLVLLAVITCVALVILGGYSATKLAVSVYPSPKDSNEIDIEVTFSDDATIREAELITRDLEKIIYSIANDHIEQVNYYHADNQSALLNLNLVDKNQRDVTAPELVQQLQSAFDRYEYISAFVSQKTIGTQLGEFPFTMQIFDEDTATLENVSVEISEYLKTLVLSSSATITKVEVPPTNQIKQLNGRQYVEISAKFSEPENTGLLSEVKRLIKNEYNKTKLEELGITESNMEFDFGPESDNSASFQSILFSLTISIIIMYALLVVKFNSFVQPFIILLAIPFSFPGIFIGLQLTQHPLSLYVIIGIVAVVGIVVNNTIMLVDLANRQKNISDGVEGAIVEAIKTRFRPIVVTTISVIAGLLPIAFVEPVWESLAFTIIFGILSSTVLTIFFFPAYYVLFESIRDLKNIFIERIESNERD